MPGFVEAATLFAQQAKGAGRHGRGQREPANAYFDTSLLYTKLDFAQSFWTYLVPLWYEQALLSDAVWNETHWRDPETDKLIRQAQGAPDEATATELWASDPGDPVRGGRLHRLGVPEPRRRRRPERAGNRSELVLQPRGLELQGRLPDVSAARVGTSVRPAS